MVQASVLSAQRGDITRQRIGLHLVEGSDDAFPIPRGHARSARCAALARFNSQFMLEVFEAHALATRVLFVGAMRRLDFLR